MRLCERRCEVCGEQADGDTSAHFARVVWLCRRHSAWFHSPVMLRCFSSGTSTQEVHETIDLWLMLMRAELSLASSWRAWGVRCNDIVSLGGGV